MSDVLGWAIRAGDVGMCELLISIKIPYQLDPMIVHGARQGRFDMIALAIQNGAQIGDVVLNLARSSDWGILLMLCHGSCSSWMTVAEGIMESGNVRMFKKCIDRIQSLSDSAVRFRSWIHDVFAHMCRIARIEDTLGCYECMNILLHYGVDTCTRCGDINRDRAEIESRMRK